MGLFNRESNEAKALKAEWEAASKDTDNYRPGTAARDTARADAAKAAQAYRDQVARDKQR